MGGEELPIFVYACAIPNIYFVDFTSYYNSAVRNSGCG